LIMRILHAVPACRCVLPVLPITDSIVVTDHGMVIDYADRSRMGRVQTPQGFTLGLIRALHEQAESDGIKHALDDGSLALSAGYSIATVTGDPKNRKLTSPADLSSD
ncbi:2-C-methyl-D-erythritol 4-phosphate cytidylyltransferase, partial [bacterium]|nr:2-C-methyl-D-erythritol 4-phosphate cytidylyltransferase [candidate division CSSED10-310 bacterium]